MLRGNEIVNKLLKNSFLDFVVPLNYIIISDFALSRFSRPRSSQTEEKWEDPSKIAEFLGSAEEMGDAKSTSLAESQCAKGSAKAVNSADHKIYF